MKADAAPDSSADPVAISSATAGAARQWTPEQLEGIRTVGKSLLVSAAAGSGKTAMLAERCAYLVCDAPPPFRCDVDELLVVTFTEAAATEMRERIGHALRSRAPADRPADAALDRQIHLLDQAAISTLHGFCVRLLRQHFHLVGLDPGFTVMSGEESHLLKLEVGRQLLLDQYELDHAGAFQRLMDHYAEGDDERLLRDVQKVHELLTSVINPAAWLDRAGGRVREAAAAPLAESALGRDLIELLARRLADLRAQAQGAIDLVAGIGGFPGYLTYLDGIARAAAFWERLLLDEGPDVLAQELDGTELPRLPSVPASTPDKETAKTAVDAVIKSLKSGEWRKLLRFTGEQWRQGMALVEPHAELFLSLVEQFGRLYQAAKSQARQVDFADLERYAFEVLRDQSSESLSPSVTAMACRRQFKHVLVDEYQDINELQDAILWLVSEDGKRRGDADRRVGRDGGPPNLFTVGDVKQSIYRFRLAEPEQFLRREERLRESADGFGQVIDLRANFRSRAPLLEAINGLFERLMTRQAAEIDYDESHQLVAGKNFPDAGGADCFTGSPMELHVLPPADEFGEAQTGAEEMELDRVEREAVLIANRIKELVGESDQPPVNVLAEDGISYRPLRHRDVVILLRSMRFKADAYARVLRAAGVPVHAQSGTGYFESVEVRDMLSLLTLLHNRRQDIPLTAVLRSPLAGLPETEDYLARIRLAYPSGSPAVPFHRAVERYAAEQADELAAWLRDFFAILHGWREIAFRRPLAEVIATVYEQTAYPTYVSGLPDGDQRQANLVELHRRAAEFGNHQRQGLGRFLEFLEGLRAEADLGQAAVVSDAEDVVRIMSVHRSKGLEFPVVVLPDLGKAFNLADLGGPITVDREAGLGMTAVDEAKQARYQSLSSVLVRERLRRKALAEELRVLYVAVTRAKEHLILIGTAGEKAADGWRARWGTFRGPLPPHVILEARTPLDWIGPVAACPADERGEIIRLTVHTAQDVVKWESPTTNRKTKSPLLERIARLEPLDPPPPEDEAARRVIERLEFVYPFADEAERCAARSVTAGVVDSRASEEIAGEKRSRPKVGTELALPRFLAPERPISAAEIGTATHVFFRHLDWSRKLDAADLDAQLAGLVNKRMLDEKHAKAVDRKAVSWFVTTPLGRLMRDRPEWVLKELPVFFAERSAGDPDEADAMDQVMVRGRLDALVALPDGVVLIDYKTDRIIKAAVPARVEQYRPQVTAYRAAVERMLGRPVAKTCLVFLIARVVVEV